MRPILKMAITGMATSTIMIGLMVLSGCGDGYGTRHKVSGTITYNGQRLPEGRIGFHPTDLSKPGAQAASGFIKDGEYCLTTFTNDDGAVEGVYNVSISARGLSEAKLAPRADAIICLDPPQHSTRAMPPIEYEASTTTPLKGIKVPGGVYNFDITN